MKLELDKSHGQRKKSCKNWGVSKSRFAFTAGGKKNQPNLVLCFHLPFISKSETMEISEMFHKCCPEILALA